MLPRKLFSVIPENFLVRSSKLFGDNQEFIRVANNDLVIVRSKHMDTKFQIIMDHIRKERISLECISTSDIIADIMSKALPLRKSAICPHAWELSFWIENSDDSVRASVEVNFLSIIDQLTLYPFMDTETIFVKVVQILNITIFYLREAMLSLC